MFNLKKYREEQLRLSLEEVANDLRIDISIIKERKSLVNIIWIM